MELSSLYSPFTAPIEKTCCSHHGPGTPLLLLAAHSNHGHRLSKIKPQSHPLESLHEGKAQNVTHCYFPQLSFLWCHSCSRLWPDLHLFLYCLAISAWKMVCWKSACHWLLVLQTAPSTEHLCSMNGKPSTFSKTTKFLLCWHGGDPVNRSHFSGFPPVKQFWNDVFRFA